MNQMSKTNTGIPGLSFSLNRALGITAAKRKIAKVTGVPTTKQGRDQKLGRIMKDILGLNKK